MPTKRSGARKKPVKAKRTATLKTPKGDANNTTAGLNLSQVGKRGLRLGIDISKSIKTATLERTLDGASTVTIEVADPDYLLINSRIFDAKGDGKVDPLEIVVDGLPFRLVKVNPTWGAQGNILSLTFEDRNVNLLRGKVGTAKVLRRDKGTRAHFIESLVKEVKAYPIPFVSPEKDKKQAIAKVKVTS